MILPEANRGDLEEIPPELARKLEFHFVRGMDEVLALALAEPLTPPRRVRTPSSRVRPPILAS